MDIPGRAFRVGGAVRDRLLGDAPGDCDWVVVGATPEAMLAAGFRPVGRDFPVFLHPQTGEEYALARTERKSAPGYRGFVVHAAPEVTLEEDLARRDLTINAMAEDADGRLVDPYGGQADLARGILRHVSDAFVEDPVRLLRLARFAARWPHFHLAPETLQLMRRMVAAGEVAALVPERVWQELARGLMERAPWRMLQVLHDCGADAVILPDLAVGEPLRRRLEGCAASGAPLEPRFACLVLGAPRTAAALRAPGDALALAAMLERECAALARHVLDADEALALFDRCDAWRRPERFEQLLQAAACACPASDGPAVLERLRQDLRRARAVDLAAVTRAASAEGLQGPAIGQRIRQARRQALIGGR